MRRRRGVMLWGATGVALVALAVLAASWDFAARPGPIVCGFRRLTGIGCPGCGLTRAAALAARGSFAESFAVHPALPLLAGEMALAWLLWGERALTGRRRRARWAAPVAIATAVALVALWIVRLGLGRLPE